MHFASAVRAILWCLLLAQFLICLVKSDEDCNTEITKSLRTLLEPQENDSIQVKSLRRQLLRKFQEAMDLAELEDMKTYKRNLASLAAYNNLPTEGKRNVEALARHGQWYKSPPELNDDDSNYKRSITNLSKNGQLPLMYLQPESQKRGIEALARSGDLHRPRNYRALTDMLEDMYDKRTISSLMRNYNPPGTTAGFGKRSLSSLAKTGDFPYLYPKRQNEPEQLGKREAGKYEGPLAKDSKDADFQKRNIQSIKAHSKSGSRSKRQAPDYYDDDNVFQDNQGGNSLTGAYDDWQQSAQDDMYPVEGKRFLGSLAKNGWFRQASGREMSKFHDSPQKRHLGSLARLGWLPGYRSIRRFSRSGRSTSNSNTCGETTSDGKASHHSYTKVTSVPLDNKKRYLLQPAVDNILLRKMFVHPRMMRY